MFNLLPRKYLACAAALLMLGGAATAQDVQSGIAAWQQGNYAAAVATWRPLAEAGNADAQFNLGQAHRLGRGVPQDLAQAEQWFERAARQRHEQAGASLGLLLFQNGRAREAMPWLQAAALRGDPRAQYVFGTALFNGDVLRRDPPRAYAMMSAAAAQGFPQAQQQLTEMEKQLTTAERDRGRAMAADLGSPAPVQVAAADPAPRVPQPGAAPRSGAGVSYAPPSAVRTQSAPAPAIAPAAEAARGSGGAGVSYTPPPENPAAPPVRRETAPVQRAEAQPAPAAPRQTPPAQRAEAARPQPAAPVAKETAPVQQAEASRPKPAAPAAKDGGWRVQLGAFSEESGARRQWTQLSRRVSALAALEPAYTKAGALTRLRAGPLASRAAADRLCSAVRAAGQACFSVKR